MAGARRPHGGHCLCTRGASALQETRDQNLEPPGEVSARCWFSSCWSSDEPSCGTWADPDVDRMESLSRTWVSLAPLLQLIQTTGGEPPPLLLSGWLPPDQRGGGRCQDCCQTGAHTCPIGDRRQGNTPPSSVQEEWRHMADQRDLA